MVFSTPNLHMMDISITDLRACCKCINPYCVADFTLQPLPDKWQTCMYSGCQLLVIADTCHQKLLYRREAPNHPPHMMQSWGGDYWQGCWSPRPDILLQGVIVIHYSWSKVYKQLCLLLFNYPRGTKQLSNKNNSFKIEKIEKVPKTSLKHNITISPCA